MAVGTNFSDGSNDSQYVFNLLCVIFCDLNSVVESFGKDKHLRTVSKPNLEAEESNVKCVYMLQIFHE